MKTKDWHDLPKDEQEAWDKSCHDGKHGKLFKEKGPMGDTGDYICKDVWNFKVQNPMNKEGRDL